MEFYNIKTDRLEEIEITDVNQLMGIHDIMRDTQRNIADYFISRAEKGEQLPSMAYNIIFENFDYENNSKEIINFLKNLMYQEQSGGLPKLQAFLSNASVLVGYYSEAMDYFVEKEICDYIEPNVTDDLPESNCIFLNNFFNNMKMNSEEDKKWLKENISKWRNEIGDFFANNAVRIWEDGSYGYTQDDYLRWCNRALHFNPNNIKALQLKILCLEQDN